MHIHVPRKNIIDFLLVCVVYGYLHRVRFCKAVATGVDLFTGAIMALGDT